MDSRSDTLRFTPTCSACDTFVFYETVRFDVSGQVYCDKCKISTASLEGVVRTLCADGLCTQKYQCCQCGVSVNFREYAAHREKDCVNECKTCHKRLTSPICSAPCEFCKTTIVCAAREKHKATCPERSIACQLKCGQMHKVCQEMQHYKQSCANYVVLCPQPNCRAQAKRCQIHEHTCPQKQANFILEPGALCDGFQWAIGGVSPCVIQAVNTSQIRVRWPEFLNNGETMDVEKAKKRLLPYRSVTKDSVYMGRPVKLFTTDRGWIKSAITNVAYEIEIKEDGGWCPKYSSPFSSVEDIKIPKIAYADWEFFNLHDESDVQEGMYFLARVAGKIIMVRITQCLPDAFTVCHIVNAVDIGQVYTIPRRDVRKYLGILGTGLSATKCDLSELSSSSSTPIEKSGGKRFNRGPPDRFRPDDSLHKRRALNECPVLTADGEKCGKPLDDGFDHCRKKDDANCYRRWYRSNQAE